MSHRYMLAGTSQSPYGPGGGSGGSGEYGLGSGSAGGGVLRDNTMGADLNVNPVERIIGVDVGKTDSGWSIVSKPTTLMAGIIGAAIAVMMPGADGKEKGITSAIFAATIGFVVGGGIATGFRAAEKISL